VPITICGIGSTLKGACDLGNGDLSTGAKSAFLGLCTTNIGARFQGLDSESHSNLMKMTCCVATEAVAIQGAARCGVGVREKNWGQILRGGVQTVAGIVGSLFIHSLDPKTIVVANQTGAAAVGSAFIAKLGWRDLVKGRHFLGLSKILLGAVGLGAAGYYAYSSCSGEPSTYSDKPGLSADQFDFLQKHKEEIEQMYDDKKPLGKWDELGIGVSKIALVHPDLPEMVVKIPHRKISGYHQPTPAGDLLLHLKNLQEAQTIVKEERLHRIVIPDSHLLPISKGIAIVEERLRLERSGNIPEGPDKTEALDQFRRFIQKSKLTDLHIYAGHNAGFIREENPLKIGIIDFDYKSKYPDLNIYGRRGLTALRWLRELPESASLFLAGSTLIAGISEAAKSFSSIKPGDILRSGFQAGILAGVSNFCFQPDEPLIHTIGVMGLGMIAAGSILSMAVFANAAYSKIKKGLEMFVPKFNSPFAGRIG
jgi:hypothetical protein